MDEQTRINMIEQQIRPWDVLDDTVLALYRAAPRHLFAPPPHQRLACADVALPIGFGQTMLEPKMEARMLQALQLQPSDSVLHIGTGSGFFASLLGRLAAKVLTVEIIPQLAEAAAERLAEQKNIAVKTADGANGMPGEGVFDAAVLTGSVPQIAPAFWKNVADGGRLLAVEGRPPAMTLSLIEKRAENILIRRDLLETCIPPLVNTPPPPFEF